MFRLSEPRACSLRPGLFLPVALLIGLLPSVASSQTDPFSLGPMTPYAVFSAQDVTVSGRVESTGGTSTAHGHVRSNGNITVNSNGKIDGDARPGPGKSASGTITGITIPSLESLSPAPIDLAVLETQVAAQNDNSKIDPKLIPNRNLTLNSGQSLPLQPGTYYLNNVNINSSATLTVSGLVKILVTGSFNLNATANAGGLAPNLRLWVKSTSSVNINSNAQMRGYVYAPNATVNVDSNATLTGGIFAKKVTVNGSTGTVKRWLGTIGLGGPSVAITEPRDGDVAANLSAVLVKGTVSDPDGVGTVSVTVNGSAVTPAANGNFEKTVDLSGSSQRRITATAVDADGQIDTKTVALCGPPPVTLTSPAHGSTVTTQTVTLTGTCGNATTLTVNGSPVTCGSGTYTASVNLGPGYGAKVITVVAQGACEASTQRFVLFYAANPDYFAMGPWMTGQAFFSCNAASLDNRAQTNSSEAPGSATNRGDAVTNKTLDLKNGARIDGIAWVGPDQPLPTPTGGASITGGSFRLASARECAPLDLTAAANLYRTQNNNSLIGRTQGGKNPLNGTQFELDNSDSITLSEGIYYFTKLTLKNGSKLNVAGAVRILCEGPVTLDNSSKVNDGGNPYNVRLWVKGTETVTPKNQSTASAFVYAPQAKVSLDNSSVVKGGVFAKEIELKNDAVITRLIDSFPPAVSIAQPAEGTTPPDLSAVLVSGTVTDADGNLATVHVNGTPVTVQPNGTYTATVNLIGMTPAVITVVAVDLAGQIAVATRTLQTCTQPPVLTMTSPVPNGFVKTPAITVTGGCGTASTVTVNGVSAPCQNATYSASITLPVGDGTKTITVVGTATGCPSATQTYTVTLDTIPPVISIESPPPGATITSSPVTVTGPVTDVNLQAVSVNGAIATFPPAGRFSATLPVTEGSVTLVAAATDKAGNATASAGIPVTVMLSGPSVTITPPEASLVKTQQVTLSGTATGTPPLTVTVSNQPAQVTQTNTWTATATLVEGPNSLTALVRDAANRTATSNTVNVELDTQAPRVTIDTPASGCRSTGTVTLGGVYADTHPATTAAVSVEIRPAGGTALTQTAAVDPATRRWTLANVSLGTANGTATVTVTAKDSLDQTSKAQAGWRIDTTAPVITLLSSGTPFPVSGSGLTPPQGTSPRLVNTVLSFTAQISDGEEAPPSPVLTLDGQPYTAGSPVATEGQHLLTARATDCAQNEGTAWALFTIDRTGANLVTTSPAEGAALTEAPASYSGTADTSLSAVKVNGTAVTPSGTSFTLSPFSSTEGENTVSIELTDAAGNETAYERHFRVKTIRPSIELVESGVSITPGAVYYRAITPEIRTNDSQAVVTATLDGQPYQSGTPVTTAGSHTISATATVPGLPGLTATATVTFAIDLSGGPSIAITSPPDGAELPGPTTAVSGTASGTGITVMVNGTPATLTGNTWTITNLPLTPDTINDIVAVVKDSRGRTASVARTVMVRSSGPRIVIT
ncbi:MAG: hypothetical protein IT186_20460, partial [Acidobacteria bacterium]|nr:hypothetical protein [Acidobacteriota bacterium]